MRSIRRPVLAAPFIAAGVEAILDPRRAGFHTIFRAERFEFLFALRVIVCNGVQVFPDTLPHVYPYRDTSADRG